MRGFEVAQTLRTNPVTAVIPIVVLTAIDLLAQDRNRLSGLVDLVLHKGELSDPGFLDALRRVTGKGAGAERRWARQS